MAGEQSEVGPSSSLSVTNNNEDLNTFKHSYQEMRSRQRIINILLLPIIVPQLLAFSLAFPPTLIVLLICTYSLFKNGYVHIPWLEAFYFKFNKKNLEDPKFFSANFSTSFPPTPRKAIFGSKEAIQATKLVINNQPHDFYSMLEFNDSYRAPRVYSYWPFTMLWEAKLRNRLTRLNKSATFNKVNGELAFYALVQPYFRDFYEEKMGKRDNKPWLWSTTTPVKKPTPAKKRRHNRQYQTPTHTPQKKRQEKNDDKAGVFSDKRGEKKTTPEVEIKSHEKGKQESSPQPDNLNPIINTSPQIGNINSINTDGSLGTPTSSQGDESAATTSPSSANSNTPDSFTQPSPSQNLITTPPTTPTKPTVGIATVLKTPPKPNPIHTKKGGPPQGKRLSFCSPEKPSLTEKKSAIKNLNNSGQAMFPPVETSFKSSSSKNHKNVTQSGGKKRKKKVRHNRKDKSK